MLGWLHVGLVGLVLFRVGLVTLRWFLVGLVGNVVLVARWVGKAGLVRLGW